MTQMHGGFISGDLRPETNEPIPS